MSTTQFLWFIFVAWIALLVTAALVQLKRPHPNSFGSAMLVLGLSTGLPTLGKAGVWWALGVAALAVVGYVALNRVVRISLRPRHSLCYVAGLIGPEAEWYLRNRQITLPRDSRP